MSLLQLNIPESLHRRAIALANSDGIPLEQFVASVLGEKIDVIDAGTYIQQRAARGSREKFDAVMAKVPNVEPEEFDQIPSK